MAENDDGQEKSEDPTAKRTDKARDEGQVPRSKELGTAVLLIVGVVGVIISARGVSEALFNILHYNLTLPREHLFNEDFIFVHLTNTVWHILQTLIPLFSIFLVASISGSIMFGGLLFSFKALMPKFNRLDPIQGIKKMFSIKSLVELLKALAKFVLVAGVAVIILLANQHSLIKLSQISIEPAIIEMVEMVIWAALYISLTLIVIAAIDVPFQAFQHKKELKMTKQEVKDERKDTEGKPEVKSKVRQLQYQMAQRRMMAAVPEADVVITNPEHFSIALKYDADGSGAPIVVAKGVDFIALKIREIASEHEVMIIPIPPLARAIYFTAEVDQEIPENLYLAVAQVLAYVFQLKAHRKGKGQRPKPLANVDIPRDSQYDHRGKRI